ncbi:MAG: helix-turn-helix domain-containing protein, partial [Planctomycetes bacterium]|nr:helix-turn-helix domain-containing protein [Planctomycetota bacterium]
MPYGSLLSALGRKIREAREARELSLQDMAERANWSRRFLIDAEAGRANPSLGKLSDLAEALGISLAELCDLPRAGRPARYAMVGLRGAGKSTLGTALARELEVPFSELDTWIELRAGMPIGEVFELEGSVGYRRHEAGALEDWLSHHGTGVLAVPGGIVQSPTYDRLLRSCRTVWLQASPEDHLERVRAQGDMRPMQGDTDALTRLKTILREREAAY